MSLIVKNLRGTIQIESKLTLALGKLYELDYLQSSPDLTAPLESDISPDSTV